MFRADYIDLDENQPNYLIKGCLLYLTCGACPEQYDVYLAETKERIGYLRLRHGRFTAEYPDVGGKLVYVSYPEGDGIFEDMERMPQLKKAITRLLEQHNSPQLELF